MKIIKDKNNIVTHVGEDLELTAEGLFGPDLRSPTVTTKTHTAEDVKDRPDNFQGGYFSYDKKWKQIKDFPVPELSPKEQAMKELNAAKAEQAGKPLSMAYLDKRLTAIEKILGVSHGIQRKRLFTAESSRFKQDWLSGQDMGFKQHHGGPQ